jgi:hypothetical protein
VIFAANCARCVRQARLISSEDVDPERTVFLITGSDRAGVEELRGLLAPTDARLMCDPEALDLLKALGVDDTPFAFLTSAGEVVAQSYLGHNGSFRSFVSPIRKPSTDNGRR